MSLENGEEQGWMGGGGVGGRERSIYSVGLMEASGSSACEWMSGALGVWREGGRERESQDL